MKTISPESFSLLCFLVLMQNGKGLIDKHPGYITEKMDVMRGPVGYSFRSLDIYNMRKVKEWCDEWKVQMPEECVEELRLQEEAFKEVAHLFEPPLKIRHYNEKDGNGTTV